MIHSNVMVKLNVVAARAKNQSNRNRAIGIDALTVFLLRRFDVGGQAEAGIQHGPVTVALRTLNLDSYGHGASRIERPTLPPKTHFVGYRAARRNERIAPTMSFEDATGTLVRNERKKSERAMQEPA